MLILDRDLQRLTQSKLLRRAFREKRWWLEQIIRHRVSNSEKRKLVIILNDPLTIRYGGIMVFSDSDFERLIAQHLTQEQIVKWLSACLKHKSKN